MNTKELLIKQIMEIPDAAPLLEEVLTFLESKKKESKNQSGLLQAWDGKTMWHGRPVVKLEDLKQIQCPFPPEPDWAEEK